MRHCHGLCLALPQVVGPRRNNSESGKWGETRAADELERLGYAILARRYRTRFGEIDIVARDGRVLVFVAVKARATGRFGSAAESVPGWKQRRIASMALDYLGRTGRLDEPCRFDVVAIDGLGSPRPVVRIIKDAFQVQ